MADELNADEMCSIFNLPDCVLSILLSYMDATTLYQLSLTCQYFKSVIESPRLWKYIDARREPNINDKVHYCTERIHEKTTHFSLRGFSNKFGRTKPEKNTNEVLILDGCKWVTCSFLVSVAKYENLEIISAVKCIRLHMDMIPYLSFTRFGCRKLKVFDCRLTGIGHELLHSFCPREAIQSLYFQGMKSSEYDYSIKAFKSAYMRKIKYPSVSVTDSTMFDESLYEYIDFISSDTIQPPPESVLYKDPYPKCTCGYKKQEGKSDVNSENESESDSDSGTESDTSCCMYGMGRKMILLTPGDNRELRQEVLQLGQDDQRERPNVNIFIASPLVESRAPNSEPDRAVPSTPRGVPENGTNENVENTRNETKRKHEGTMMIHRKIRKRRWRGKMI
ncbi:hypothetical protein NQ318_021574 [Aromia moschata]|uniref:F-box domain-containing protein n=1 Tax=Aromia moschata TaxID=1265417 RepID=A0AAV8YKH1_9CUCU|nr:hypothetical protein NQ318_021574 [Aromia moschata]